MKYFAIFPPVIGSLLVFACAQPASIPTATVLVNMTTPVSDMLLQTTPEPLCDDALILSNDADEEVFEVLPGEVFTKIWTIKNVGFCTWNEQYQVVFQFGERLAGRAQTLKANVTPGNEVNVKVEFTAPIEPGEYVSAWSLANADGYPFGKFFYVRFFVK